MDISPRFNDTILANHHSGLRLLDRRGCWVKLLSGTRVCRNFRSPPNSLCKYDIRGNFPPPKNKKKRTLRLTSLYLIHRSKALYNSYAHLKQLTSCAPINPQTFLPAHQFPHRLPTSFSYSRPRYADFPSSFYILHTYVEEASQLSKSKYDCPLQQHVLVNSP